MKTYISMIALLVLSMFLVACEEDEQASFIYLDQEICKQNNTYCHYVVVPEDGMLVNLTFDCYNTTGCILNYTVISYG